MKNQYFGDIQDYRKYGMLRQVLTTTGLRLGVCWMRTDDDESSDGEKRSYLAQPEKWRFHDAPLYDALRGLQDSGAPRSLAHVQDLGLLPGATFFTDRLQDDAESRSAYFARCREALAGVDLVFFDPDTGLEIQSKRRGAPESCRYLYWDEVTAFYQTGRSVLIYQHWPRKPRDEYLAQRVAECQQHFDGAEVLTVRTSDVLFLMALRPEHAARFERLPEHLMVNWGARVVARRHPARSIPTPKVEGGAAEVVGVDVAKGKWVAVALSGGRYCGALLATTLDEVVAAFPEASVVGVDVPIGYPAPGQAERPGDVAARAALTSKARNRLFAVPPAEVLAAPTHAEATRRATRLTGKGISQQSYALRHAIFYVEGARARHRDLLHEVHPELSFLAMAARPEGGPFQPEDRWPGLGASKKTWNGMRARLDVLEARGIVIPANLPGAGKAPVDDLLDAAAAAWTADRIRRGVAESFPPGLQGPGEVGIWY